MDVLLIPGFMLDADLWRDMRLPPSLSGRTIHADTTRDTSVEAMADRAAARLCGPTLVVGFSMGGYVARHLAYQVPAQVSGLVLIATASRGSESTTLPPIGVKGLSRGAVAASLHPDHRTEALIRRVQKMGERLGGTVFERQSRVARPDDTARLGGLTAPTLIVGGAQDQLRPLADSRLLHAGIPNSALRVIEHTGHLVPLEQPDALSQILQAWWETSSLSHSGSAERAD